MPTPLQTFFSILCIFIWSGISLLCGYYNEKWFLLFNSLYWGIGVLLFALGYYTDEILVSLPSVFLMFGPIYGLRQFIRMPSDIKLVFYIGSLVYLIIILSYLLGDFLKKRHTKK
jgi:hypothetical protein